MRTEALRLADTANAKPIESPPPVTQPAIAVERLLWGWPEILQATGIPRQTLEREIAVGRFPKSVMTTGRRPYWKPAHVRRWANGGKDA